MRFIFTRNELFVLVAVLAVAAACARNATKPADHVSASKPSASPNARTSSPEPDTDPVTTSFQLPGNVSVSIVGQPFQSAKTATLVLSLSGSSSRFSGCGSLRIEADSTTTDLVDVRSQRQAGTFAASETMRATAPISALETLGESQEDGFIAACDQSFTVGSSERGRVLEFVEAFRAKASGSTR